MKVLDQHIPRGADPTGHGDYGKSRGKKRHQGFDLLANPGDAVFSPITGFISKIGYCYSFAPEFRYVEISNDEYRWRLMYVLPIDGLFVGQRVVECDIIGQVQDIAIYWNKDKKEGQAMMLNHLHAQVYKNGLLTDSEPLLMVDYAN